MRILVATPCYDLNIQAPLYYSMVAMIGQFARLKPEIAFEVAVYSGSLIDKMRNAFASRVLAEDSFTHLLFLDSDMGFKPSLIDKMLAFPNPIVGCVCPAKNSSPSDLLSWADPKTAHVATQRYVNEDKFVVSHDHSVPGSKPQFRMSDGFLQVSQIGAGIALISRDALLQMKNKFPELYVKSAEPLSQYKDFPSCKNAIFQCFSPVQLDGLFLSEDVSFSYRWVVGCKGALWACANEEITHVGRNVAHGAFLNKVHVRTSGELGQP